MSIALEIFQARQDQLRTCRRKNYSAPPGNTFTDPRLEPVDKCAKAHQRDHFPGNRIRRIIAADSERAVAVNLAIILSDISTAEIPASVIPKAIQATDRFITRRQVLMNPLSPTVITQSELVTEETIHISPNNDLVIASSGINGSRRLDIITGKPNPLSTDRFQSLETTLIEVAKKAA